MEQLKPETKYTSRKVQVDGITLYDSEASFRRNFLKKHLKNTVAAFAAGLYWLTEYRGFMFVYAAVMAESLADSVASKIGPLTDGRTVDICTFRPAQAGISGAVSLAGTLAALMGSMCIGLLWLVSRAGAAQLKQLLWLPSAFLGVCPIVCLVPAFRCAIAVPAAAR